MLIESWDSATHYHSSRNQENNRYRHVKPLKVELILLEFYFLYVSSPTASALDCL